MWLALRRSFAPEFDRTMGLMMWYNNSNGIPIILAASLASTLVNLDLDVAIKYIGFYSALCQCVCWTIGRVIVVSESMTMQRMEKGEQREAMWKKFFSSVRTRIFTTVTPIILGIIYGCGGKFSDKLFMDEGAPLQFLWKTLDLFAVCAIPLPNMTLGCMIYTEKIDVRENLKTSLIVSTCRLILVPLGAFIILQLIPISHGDVLKLVIMVEAMSPTANNVVMMLDADSGSLVQEVTRVMVFEYLVAVVTVTMWLTIFLEYGYDKDRG
jgi:predicted permease